MKDIDDCAQPLKNERNDLEEIRRDSDSSLTGFRCKICNGWWKIYQNRYHNPGCKYKSGDKP